MGNSGGDPTPAVGGAPMVGPPGVVTAVGTRGAEGPGRPGKIPAPGWPPLLMKLPPDPAGGNRFVDPGPPPGCSGAAGSTVGPCPRAAGAPRTRPAASTRLHRTAVRLMVSSPPGFGAVPARPRAALPRALGP